MLRSCEHLRAPLDSSHFTAGDGRQGLTPAHACGCHQARGEPARVAVLYERAVAMFPVTHALWLRYGRYLEAHLRVPGVVQRVYGRAVRNCPWVGALWARWGCLIPCTARLPSCG